MLIVKVYDTAVYAQDFKYETLIIMLLASETDPEGKAIIYLRVISAVSGTA